MTPKEAIETIKSNWPPSNYTMLREALTLAVELLETKADPETPTLTVKQVNEAVDYAFKANWESGHYDSEQRFKRFLAERLQQNGG